MCGLVVVWTLCGCGASGPEKVDIAGTLTYQGKPVNDGAVMFLPAEGSSVPIHPVQVVGGKFEASGENGLIVGKYRVQFHSYEKVFGGDNEGDSVPGMELNKELLPEKYHQRSTEVFEAKSGSDPVTLDYKLE